MKKKVIIITDGDSKAEKAVKIAGANIRARTISASRGNPTRLTGDEVLQLIKRTPFDPVLVMVDDKGKKGYGLGESVMLSLLCNEEIKVIGIVAVASNCTIGEGIEINYSIDKNNKVASNAVDKEGNIIKGKVLNGDTFNCLHKIKDIPFVVGVGDIGKIKEVDDSEELASPILTSALKLILEKYKDTEIL